MTDKDKLLKMNNSSSDEDPLAELIVPDVTGLTRLDAALAYAKAGIYILPCRKGTANPGSLLCTGWPTMSSRDPDVIREWWEWWPCAEIALHAGRSGLVIFDVDVSDAVKVPVVMHKYLATAPKQTTRADDPIRGHYLFRQPPGRRIGNGRGKLAKGWGEVRGSNGVIILAPSRHRKAHQGGKYCWRRCGPQWPVRVLPDELADLLTDSTDPKTTLSDADLTAFLDTYTRKDHPGRVSGPLNWYRKEVEEENESRHDSMVKALCWAFRESIVGACPARTALDRLGAAWEASFRPPSSNGDGAEWRDRAPGRDELSGIASWAAAQALNTNPEETRERMKRASQSEEGADDEDARVEEVRTKQRVQMKGTAAARHDLAMEGWSEPPDEGSLADQEANPAPEIGFLVEQLIPAEGIVQANAQYKAGKTTLVSVNLVKALAEGSPFLRRFAVNFTEQDGCVAVWNMEVSARTLQNWLFRAQMKTTAKRRVFPKHLRGQHIDLQSEVGADWAVRWLVEHNIKVWILDPLSKIYHGDENSNTEFNQWWKALEQIMSRAGVRVTVLVHHSGHGVAGDGDAIHRGRGASAMMGNPDVLISYRHGGDHGSIPPDSRRYLAAFGREVSLPEVTLDHDPLSGEMYAVDAVGGGTSGGRNLDRLSRMGIAAAKAVWKSAEDYLSKVKVERAIGKGDTNTKRDAIEWARDAGYIVVTEPEKKGLPTKISRGAVKPPTTDAGTADTGAAWTPQGKLKIGPSNGSKSGRKNGVERLITEPR